MPSSASDKLKLELQAAGENDQTWGAKINVALERLEQATAGETTVSLQALGGANYTLDDTQYVKGSGTTAEAHRMVLNLTGTMDANENVIVPARTKLYVVRNNTSGSFTATVKTSAGTGIAVTQGTSALLYCDGTNVVDMLAAYDLSGDFALPGDITPSQITANTNDYAPTGLSTATVLRLDTDASRNLTGLTGGADGRIIIIDNIGSFDLVLTDEDAASTAANRFALAGNATVPAGGTIALKYDSTASRWRAFGGLSQGDIGVTVQAHDDDTLKADTGDTLTEKFTTAHTAASSSSNAVTLSFANTPKRKTTLTENITTVTISGTADGDELQWAITGATGPFTVSGWAAAGLTIEWSGDAAPTISLSANEYAIVTFTRVGTILLGNSTVNFGVA